MLNQVSLMGRLVHDPELRYTPNQTPVATFSVAVERDIAGQSGEKATDFFDCVAWRNTALFVDKYFRKGYMAVLNGKLQTREWTDKKTNTKRRATEVVVENIYFGQANRM